MEPLTVWVVLAKTHSRWIPSALACTCETREEAQSVMASLPRSNQYKLKEYEVKLTKEAN
jgi:hypothetical protein